MLSTPLKLVTLSVAFSCAGFQFASARDAVTITIPMHSKLTPVQRLNREGVEAVNKHDYEKAESLFYKAYLYDPADPFTLNNLGFIAELQGQLDRANKFYQLASQQGSNADIDLSSVKHLQGQPMKSAFENLHDTPMRVNRLNVNAIRLLSENRGSEAIDLLRRGLTLDPKNPFTLNNLGVAEESVGDYESALRYYSSVAIAHSADPAIIASDRSWSGKSVSEMAAANAARLDMQSRNGGPGGSQAAMYSLRGVLAVNQNDLATAKQDFMRAYALDPSNAFSLNNRGYVAELEGDPESAQFFYEKARKAGDANTPVGLATQPSAQGKSLFTLAEDSNFKVDAELERSSQKRHQETGPIELTPRGNATSGDSQVSPDPHMTPKTPLGQTQNSVPNQSH
jgi:Flp pilus assembly protein TadD